MKYLNFVSKKLLFASLLLTLTACTNNHSKLKLVFPNKVNYESFILAHHFKYFNESEIEVITVNSGINAAEAFSLGEAQAAAMGDGPTVMLMDKKKDLVILTRYAQGNKIHRLIANTSIKTGQQLVGKRIGVQQGSSTHGALLSWLHYNGVEKELVTIVPMDPNDMPEAMKTKQLDAVAGSEPWALNVQKMCKKQVHELANLENPANSFPHTLVSNTKTVKDKTAHLQMIIEALNKANSFIKQYPDSAAKIAAKYIGISAEEEKTCLGRLNWECGWTTKDAASLMETAKFFHNSNKIERLPKIEKYIVKLDK